MWRSKMIEAMLTWKRTTENWTFFCFVSKSEPPCTRNHGHAPVITIVNMPGHWLAAQRCNKTTERELPSTESWGVNTKKQLAHWHLSGLTTPCDLKLPSKWKKMPIWSEKKKQDSGDLCSCGPPTLALLLS